MRCGSFVVFATLFGGMIGCNEIVSTTVESATAIDVVGEPADPTPDSMRPADIVGAERTSQDQGNAVADLESTPSIAPERTDESSEAETEANPNVVGGTGVAKPVSLKKQLPASTLERK